MRFIIFAAIFVMMTSAPIFAQESTSADPSKTTTISGDFTHPACPDKIKGSFKIDYPLQTANSLQDLILTNHTEYLLGGFLNDVNDLIGDPSVCDREYEIYYNTTSTSTKASNDYLSIFFAADSYTGGAHGNLDYSVVNFKKDGYLMGLNDLFPNQVKSLPLYFALVYATTCKSGFDTTPAYFGSENCGGKPDGQAYLSNPIDQIADLGNLTFSPEGATIHLTPYDCWSWANGPFDFNLSKEDLIAIGANPAIWGN
ncbi:MAG: DUF4163 domain-containing protein [Deltaproteobacteria bacterium]|jgi:hypothetical protein|nr:DUF4163 domain-containing protein [Deltaproteobacteria bacterium]